MVDIFRKSARSVAEFIQIIEEIRPSTSAGAWFRGQRSARYRLTPGVLRKTAPVTDSLGRPIKEGQIVTARGGAVTGLNPERMLAAFRRHARPFVEWSPANDFEWMFIAQHHRLSTRLLDWTTNALVALYFAVSEAEVRVGDGSEACKEFCEGDDSRDDGSSVFAIDPGAMNNAVCDIAEPIDVGAEPGKWSAYLRPMSSGLDAYAPICILAPHIASRIRAQSGVFTLHGSNIDPIDYYDIFRPMITKIFVPYTSTVEIMQALIKLGVTRSLIYPGLDSIAQDIVDEERIRHNAEKAERFKLADENEY